jgi:hypothetical protein
LNRLADFLENLATVAYGPLPRRKRRPGLGIKLFVLSLFVALIVLGLAGVP